MGAKIDRNTYKEFFVNPAEKIFHLQLNNKLYGFHRA